MLNSKEYQDRLIRHGEVLLVPVEAVPANAEMVMENVKDYVVAHSETGHNHVAYGDVSVFKQGNDVYLNVGEATQLRHLKDTEFHETKSILPGAYKVNLKTEYDPFEKARRTVMD